MMATWEIFSRARQKSWHPSPMAFAATVLLCGGCASTGALDQMTAVSPVAEMDLASVTAPPDGQTIELSKAVIYALASNPKISALRAAVHRAGGNAAEAATPRSPEFRFGFAREDESSRGWAHETETGSNRRSGTEADIRHETDSETMISERWQSGALEETATRTRNMTADGWGDESSFRRSRYRDTAYTADIGGQSEDSLRLGIRYFPPNPWLMAAAGGAARAARCMAQAELVEKEHEVICEMIEAAIQIAYGQRVLRIHEAFATECRIFYEDIQKASEGGQLGRMDLVDVRLRLASAEADKERAADRLASWKQKFRMIGGIDPESVVLTPVEAGAICPLKLTAGSAESAAVVRTLARQRPDVLAAHWNRLRYEQEWKEARASGYPWLNHVELAYTRWDIFDQRQRTVDKSWNESGTSSQSSVSGETRNETEQTQTSNGETETGVGQGSRSVISSSSGEEADKGSGRSKEYSAASADADEWWVGLSVDIPIFEWLSKQSGERHKGLVEAQRGYELGRARAEREILMAGDVLRQSRANFERLHASFEKDRNDIEELAEASARTGVDGRLDALRLKERSTELAILTLDKATGVALDELQLCRVSGLAPGQRVVVPPSAAESQDAAPQKTGPKIKSPR